MLEFKHFYYAWLLLLLNMLLSLSMPLSKAVLHVLFCECLELRWAVALVSWMDPKGFPFMVVVTVGGATSHMVPGPVSKTGQDTLLCFYLSAGWQRGLLCF